MVAEAEQFAAEDEAQRKRIEALNQLSSFVYGLKTQLGDSEGMGGKLGDEDKKTILATVKETTDWIDENGQTASVEDLEEKLAGQYHPISHSLPCAYSVLQRSKVLSTPLPLSCTTQLAVPVVMMTNH